MNRSQQETQRVLKAFGLVTDEPDEPTVVLWDDYDELSAKDVVARLKETNPSDAEIATMKTYEAANKNRKTVLEALDEVD